MRQKERNVRIPREVGDSAVDPVSAILVGPFRAMIQYPQKCLNQFQPNRWIRLESAEYPLARALRGEKTRIEEALCLRGDGTEAWVSMLGASIVREDSSVEGAVVVVQDIDEIKRERERLLSLAEALIKELKGQTSPARSEPI